jgi:hypothetical protein
VENGIDPIDHCFFVFLASSDIPKLIEGRSKVVHHVVTQFSRVKYRDIFQVTRLYFV